MIKVKEVLSKVAMVIKRLWNKGRRGKAIVILGTMIILGAILPDVTNESTTINARSQIVDRLKESTKEDCNETEIIKTPKEQFEEIVSKKYEGKYKIDIDSEINRIIVTSDIKDNLSNNLIQVGFESDIYHILKESQNNEYLNQYESICFVGETMFINKYGEEIKGNGFIYTFDMEDIKRVNFDNIYYNELVELTKSKFIHPSFSR